MRSAVLAVLLLAFGIIAPRSAENQNESILIDGGLVIDGSGRPGRFADVRVKDGKIAAIGNLSPMAGEKVLDAKGLMVAPGFIDAHSHTDRPMSEHPTLESQVRQGITTAIVGQDGGSTLPISKFYSDLEKARPAINFATFAGHGSIRSQVMGEDYRRAATDAELQKMRDALDQAMKDGALGLSSGLEYDPGFYSGSIEVIELAKVAARYGGLYISHTRADGGGSNMQSLEELRLVAKEARIPAQISHIKLAVPEVWRKAPAVTDWIDACRRDGLDITADIYPYLYWQSTITVLTSERDSLNREVWRKTLESIGGGQVITLVRYTPDRTWEGKTLAEIAKASGKDVVDVVLEIVTKTRAPNTNESESIVCRAMIEEDLVAFLKDPHVMFCSDGSHGGSHPRGAGSFPKIFGEYVREKGVLSMEEAVRKASAFPARRFGLADRGEIQRGKVADIVVFDRQRIRDRATVADSRAMSEGVVHVLVNGVPVLESEKLTGARPGRGLRRDRR